jgi:hypothetical protein
MANAVGSLTGLSLTGLALMGLGSSSNQVQAFETAFDALEAAEAARYAYAWALTSSSRHPAYFVLD